MDSMSRVNGDGIPDAWELQHAPLLSMLGVGDTDGDEASDLAEYHADTDPLDSRDALRVTRSEIVSGTRQSELTWTSQPTRLYRVRENTTLDASTSLRGSFSELARGQGWMSRSSLLNPSIESIRRRARVGVFEFARPLIPVHRMPVLPVHEVRAALDADGRRRG